MGLKIYATEINGYPATVQLTDEDAEARGLTAKDTVEYRQKAAAKRKADDAAEAAAKAEADRVAAEKAEADRKAAEGAAARADAAKAAAPANKARTAANKAAEK
ncbi:hypothetical protein [Prescottella equi]|uniref:hypothetical protein n=1 Tax=Rhodococcus hoagii TaxID=43767 RepID=UPI000A247FAF|nr:hypothetical protein [Prescottella equi]ORL30454.1 hypothetical protein A6I91_21185 [Prescottella equi]